jgi:hypothetical protein
MMERENNYNLRLMGKKENLSSIFIKIDINERKSHRVVRMKNHIQGLNNVWLFTLIPSHPSFPSCTNISPF